MAAMTAAGSGTGLMAQAVPPAADGGVPTLHVYTNLVQVPTLVLTMTNDPIGKPIAETRFSVSIDSGRWFRATHVRQEGDDPISLSILLDVSGDTADVMPKMEDALGKLALLSLHPRDRVSVYALDCTLRRSLHDAPADSVSLKRAAGVALEPWMMRKRAKQGEGCELRGHLWDGLGAVAVALSDLPGRRVILAVTDGRDTGSKNSWNAVRYFAQTKGIAVFALNYAPVSSMGMGNYRAGRGGYLPGGGGASAVEEPLFSVCELSGGLVMRMNDSAALSKSLERFVTLLRERYIVEFPRAANSTAGEHGMEVKIDKGIYKIRPSGVSVPLPDPAWMADPTTIQTGPSQTPEEGKRKVVNKPQ
ncbi:MAG TPA: hypothetical protein VNY74_09155 [Edaphobacter sp.]|nr:hypothetical protein [Edaphobacter sp.]